MPDPIWPTTSATTNFAPRWNYTTATSTTSRIVYSHTGPPDITINACTWNGNYYGWGNGPETGPFYTTTPTSQPLVAIHANQQLRSHVAACRDLDASDAGERAFELLSEWVPGLQREPKGGFYVTGSGGDRFYIERGYPNGNVFRLQGTEACSCGADCEFPCWQREGLAPPCTNCGCSLERERKIAVYCLHPPDPVPTDDTCLAQKLLLETNQPAFEAAANITQLASAA